MFANADVHVTFTVCGVSLNAVRLCWMSLVSESGMAMQSTTPGVAPPPVGITVNEVAVLPVITGNRKSEGVVSVVQTAV